MKPQTKLVYSCNPNHATKFSRKIYHSTKREINPKMLVTELGQVDCKKEIDHLKPSQNSCKKTCPKNDENYPFMEDDDFTSMFNKWEESQKKTQRKTSECSDYQQNMTLNPAKLNTEVKNKKLSTKNRFIQEFITHSRSGKLRKNSKARALESKRRIIRKSKVRVAPEMRSKKPSSTQIMASLKSKLSNAFNTLGEPSIGENSSTQDSARRRHSNCRPYVTRKQTKLLPELKHSNRSIFDASQDMSSERCTSQNPINYSRRVRMVSKEMINMPSLVMGKPSKNGSKSRGKFQKFTILPKTNVLSQEGLMSEKRNMMRSEKLRLYGY
ncbi:unnamed protein product [Moneuplotes crassus]|uniref:Uncharacterized protein n=1 Tax=Euplotes crassus TaxID=5936 RepID=A0AAD1XIT1_EUPCR|nr:unnamed protein product [Moneuplotes crassus]